MLIMVGIVLTTTANYYLVHSCRERSGPRWHTFSYLPFIWGASIGAGLLIMILQVWTDFAWGPDDLRMTMFSLIGVGLCGTYGGYLALIVVGRERIFEITRRCGVHPAGHHRSGDSGSNVAGQSKHGWTRDDGAFHHCWLDYNCCRSRVLHLGRLYGTNRRQEGSNHCSGCIRSAGASGVYYRRRRLVGQFPRRCNTVCPRRDSLRVHHYHWAIAGAAFPREIQRRPQPTIRRCRIR